jgi:hypothetical protein
MAMTKCKECGAELSTKATTCPHCGAARKKSSGCALVVLVVLVVIVITIVGANSGGGGTSTPSSTASSVAPSHNVAKAKAPDPAAAFAKRKESVVQVEQRLKDNTQQLKKYYASADQVKQSELDIVQLTFVKTAYSTSKVKEQRDLAKQASALVPRVAEQARTMYASALEETFVKNGMDVKVRALGGDKTHLRLTFALMSKPLVYKFQNEIKLAEQARPLGFTRIIYTNGFESSLGETWTVKL